MANVEDFVKFVLSDLDPLQERYESSSELIKKWDREQRRGNPFAQKTQPDKLIFVDSDVYAAKLDDSYHLGRIVKWFLDNVEDFQEHDEAFNGDISASIMDYLNWFKEQEDKVNAVRNAIA